MKEPYCSSGPVGLDHRFEGIGLSAPRQPRKEKSCLVNSLTLDERIWVWDNVLIDFTRSNHRISVWIGRNVVSVPSCSGYHMLTIIRGYPQYERICDSPISDVEQRLCALTHSIHAAEAKLPVRHVSNPDHRARQARAERRFPTGFGGSATAHGPVVMNIDCDCGPRWRGYLSRHFLDRRGTAIPRS